MISNQSKDNWLYLTRIDRQLLGESKGMPVGTWCLSPQEFLCEADLDGPLVDSMRWCRTGLQENNQDLTQSFERLLPLLGQALNKVHGTSYGTRFWRTTCGYWFQHYLGVLYERYRTLLAARDKFTEIKVALIPEDLEWVATDTDEYAVAVFSDRLNHQLFGQIIRARKLFTAEERSDLTGAKMEQIGRSFSLSSIKLIASWISCILGKFNTVVFLRAYYSKALLTKLAFRFLSVPLLGTPRIGGHWVIDRKRRADLDTTLASEARGMNLSDFECLATELIPSNIPGVFLERFKELLRLARLMRPYRAKLFVTANAFATQEIYKVWVGLSLEEESGIHVIMQHGGMYGHSDVFSSEEFEIGSCSEFLTSGWVNEGKTNVRPFYLSVLSGLGNFRHNQPANNCDGNVIWVLASCPRYCYLAWSGPQGSAFIEFLCAQVSFVNALSKKVRGKVLCRPYHYDYGWNDLAFIEHHCGKFRVDHERKPLRGEMASAQLMVFTYESTSMMESMVMNVPTICFWDPELFIWRPQARPLLKRLAEVGIYHEQAVAASEFINRHMTEETIRQWWSSPEVQKVRREYCEQYVNTSDNEYAHWSKQIKSWLCES